MEESVKGTKGGLSSEVGGWRLAVRYGEMWGDMGRYGGWKAHLEELKGTVVGDHEV